MNKKITHCAPSSISPWTPTAASRRSSTSLTRRPVCSVDPCDHRCWVPGRERGAPGACLLSSPTLNSASSRSWLTTSCRASWSSSTGNSSCPYRNPDILPTGRSMHVLDPSSIPTTAAIKAAEQVVRKLLEKLLMRTMAPTPESIAFTLWETDNIKTYGESLAQVLTRRRSSRVGFTRPH